jgi:hypothetical protein
MTTEHEHVSIDDRMKRLEQKAELLRSRFLRTVDALDARRHQVAAVGKQAKALAKPALMSVLGAAAVVGVGVFALAAAFRARRHRSLSDRVTDQASRALAKIDRAREPSLPRRVFERVTLAIVTFVASEFVKRVTKNIADGRYPDGRLAARQSLGSTHAPLALPSGGR